MNKAIVMTNCTEGADEEFNRWYDEVHLGEVIEFAGAIAASRYRLSEYQAGEVGGFRYLAIYEIEADSLEAALEKLNAGSGTMEISEALDMNSATAIAFSAIGERMEAN